ncbi:MAG: phage protease [Candidatus Binataceae bacterium]
MNEPSRQNPGAYRGDFSVHGAVLAQSAAAPEWIELLPAGDFSGRDGRGPFRLARPAVVVAATRALRMEAGIPIDYDHATDFAAPKGRPAPAAGWIRELQVRGGAIWGRVEWTRHGAAAVATREYRYISPVFEYAKNGEVVRLLRAALTNNPNLYLTAISASAARDHAATEAAHGPAGADGRGRQGALPMDELLAQLREIMGLDDAADAAEIVTAVSALALEDTARAARDDAMGDDAASADEAAGDAAAQEMSAAAQRTAGADPARYVPLAHFQKALTELNALRAARVRERAEHMVNEAIRSGRLTPAQREWAISYCQADHAGFATFVGRQPAVLAGLAGFDGEPTTAGIHGANGGGIRADPMRGGASAALNRTELAICARLGLAAEDFLQRKTLRVDFLRLNQG